MTYEGELDEQGLVPAEAMIAGMAELTGWNLDLADEITSGPGGMTVSFADTCSIFTGPPTPQKEEFHVYDAGELAGHHPGQHPAYPPVQLCGPGEGGALFPGHLLL